MGEQTQIVVQKGKLVVDSSRCHGCQSCMVACSLVHEGQVIPSLARIQVVLNAFDGVHLIRTCHQCRNAPCAASCPQEAIYLVEEADYWAVDEDLCTGCGVCAEACPFDAIIIHPVTHKMLKCDTCQGEPACVQSCPKGALTWEVKAS